MLFVQTLFKNLILLSVVMCGVLLAIGSFTHNALAATVFEEPVNYVIGDLGDGEHGGNISDAVVVDLNGDGYLDIAGAIPEAGYDPNEVPNPDQGVVTLLNDGAGNYTIASYIVYQEMPTSIIAGDFDGDGDADLATNSNYDDIVVLNNDGTGQFSITSRPETGYVAEKLKAADFNNDGYLDIAVSVVDATQSGLPENIPGVHIFLNNGNGAFTLDSTILTSTIGFTRISDFTVSDFDSDGDVDLVAGSGNGVLVYTVAINDGGGVFQTTDVELPLYGEFVETVSLDIDNDGDEDVLTNGVDAGSLILLNDGVGNFTFNQALEFQFLENLTATDFDGDGDIDVVATNAGINEVYLFANDGTGTLVRETVATLSFGAFTSVNVYDLNADNKKDIVVSSAQQLGIWVILQADTGEPTPAEQATILVNSVINLDLPNNLENSYLANLFKVEGFVGSGQVTPAINQLNAFINKVNQDYNQGKITLQNRDDLVGAAEQLIDDLENL